MPESDPLKILLAHDHWASAQILDACARLAPDQFHRRFDIGPGSLHDTLTHMIAAARAWCDTLAGRQPRPRLETDGQSRVPMQLRALLDESHRELYAEAYRRPLDETVIRTMR